MEFNGSFHIGQKENLRYNCYIVRGKIWRGAVIVCAAILVMTGLVRFGQGGSWQDALLATLPYALGGGALIVALNYLLIFWRVRGMYRKGAIRPFVQEAALRDDGVALCSDTGVTALSWDELTGAMESRKDFYLCIAKGGVYVLPKEQLAKPEDVACIRQILSSHIDAGKLRLRKS